MKNILSIGCALLILSACQKNITPKSNHNIKAPIKQLRHNGVHALIVDPNTGVASYGAVEDYGGSINLDNRYELRDASGNPIANVTGLAYDVAQGVLFILHRPNSGVDWEISRVLSAGQSTSNIGICVPFVTLQNTSSYTGLCDLETDGSNFYLLDRSDLANKNFKIGICTMGGGSTPVIFGTTLTGGTIDVQSIYIDKLGQIFVLDKVGTTNQFEVRQIDPLSLNVINNTSISYPQVASAVSFSLANFLQGGGDYYLTLDDNAGVGASLNNLSFYQMSSTASWNPSVNGLLPANPSNIIDLTNK
jgi:hypothetical protein